VRPPAATRARHQLNVRRDFPVKERLSSGVPHVPVPTLPRTPSSPRIRLRCHPGSGSVGPLVGPAWVHEYVSHIRVPRGWIVGLTAPTIQTNRSSWPLFPIRSFGLGTSICRTLSCPFFSNLVPREPSLLGSESSTIASLLRTGASSSRLPTSRTSIGSRSRSAQVRKAVPFSRQECLHEETHRFDVCVA
jgi:hypothetical protein